MAGCSAGEQADPPAASSTSSPSDTAVSDPPSAVATPSGAATEVVESSEDIDIGGRELHLRCWGEATAAEPTVLLLAGSHLDTSSWELMAAELSTQGHHLCAYDRLGVGRSDAPRQARRTTTDQVDDLVALLDVADLNEPVVVAAHSLGSLPALEFAARAPRRVAGLVFVDPWSPRVSAAQRAALPPKKPDESPELAEERRFLDGLGDPSGNPEHLHLAECDRQAARMLDKAGPVFGDLPVVVLGAPPLPYLPGLPRRYHEATVAAIADGAAEFAAESRHGSLVNVEDTGHNIQDDQPQVVRDAVLEVIDG